MSDVAVAVNGDEEPTKAEIVLYQQDGHNVPVRVSYWAETFWMDQRAIADMFDTTQQNISLHLKNVYVTGELSEEATHKDFLLVRHEGSREVQRRVASYNLDAIIAVGYRVNSMQATKFRQWATATLKEYVIKGFVLNDDMLKNGRPFGQDHFDELLERIRDIRASERRFYQKIADLFQDISEDYDPQSPVTHQLYAAIQNQFHYAISGYTAAELVSKRADASQPHMGLTSWKGSPEKEVHSSDVGIAKNYLTEDELKRMNQLVSGFIDAAELRVQNHQVTTMAQCLEMCQQYVLFTGGKILTNKGSVSSEQAKRKAKKEFRTFDAQRHSDFDKFVERVKHEEESHE